MLLHLMLHSISSNSWNFDETRIVYLWPERQFAYGYATKLDVRLCMHSVSQDKLKLVLLNMSLPFVFFQCYSLFIHKQPCMSHCIYKRFLDIKKYETAESADIDN